MYAPIAGMLGKQKQIDDIVDEIPEEAEYEYDEEDDEEVK